MRGLKRNGPCTDQDNRRRIFYRCVDWNLLEVTPIRKRKQSHLLQMRGLKLEVMCMLPLRIRRIFYRCVDWNPFYLYHPQLHCQKSHLLQMRGLKPLSTEDTCPKESRIFYRCVDWNRNTTIILILNNCRIFYRCVDWNRLDETPLTLKPVASFTDAWIETRTHWNNSLPS